MQKKTFFILFACLTMATLPTLAQYKTAPKHAVRWSFGVDGGLPTGKFNDHARWNLGGSAQLDVNLAKNVLYFTANAGYNNFYADSAKMKVQMIPVKLGLKYFPVKNLYVQGEAGVSFLTNKDKIDADNSANFVYAPQIGYLIPLGGRHFLDAGIRYEHHSEIFNNGYKPGFLGLRLAYAINAN